MTTATLTACEDFYRGLFNAAIEEHRPVGPLAKIAVDCLLSETASHVGAEELKGSRAADPSRFVVCLAISVLCTRYSSEVVALILSLDNGPNAADVTSLNNRSFPHLPRIANGPRFFHARCGEPRGRGTGCRVEPTHTVALGSPIPSQKGRCQSR